MIRGNQKGMMDEEERVVNSPIGELFEGLVPAVLDIATLIATSSTLVLVATVVSTGTSSSPTSVLVATLVGVGAVVVVAARTRTSVLVTALVGSSAVVVVTGSATSTSAGVLVSVGGTSTGVAVSFAVVVVAGSRTVLVPVGSTSAVVASGGTVLVAAIVVAGGGAVLVTAVIARGSTVTGSGSALVVVVVASGGTVVTAVVVVAGSRPVTSIVVAGVVRNGKVDDIIEGTVLSNSDESRLMVGGGVDGSSTVNTSGEATSDGSGKNSVYSRIVQTLEERELGRVRNGSGGEGINLLNHDMRMRNEDALSINLRRGSEVVGRGVDEVAGLHVSDGDIDGKVSIGLNGVEIRRVLEFGRRHGSSGENPTHDRRVTTAALDLLSIREGNAVLSETEIDEVVVGREGSDLTGFSICSVTVLLKTRLDLGRIEGEGGLRIVTTVVAPIVSSVVASIVGVIPVIATVVSSILIAAVLVVCGCSVDSVTSTTTKSGSVAGDGGSSDLLESGESEKDE